MKKTAHDCFKQGPSIRAQLSSHHQKLGLVIVTFWYDDSVTRVDGYGHYKEFSNESTDKQKQYYYELIDRGYTVVTEFSTRPNNEDTYRKQLFGL